MLETLDAVIDVGGVYDPITDRFDHHQKGFTEVFGHGLFNTKLSSAGLVYKVNPITYYVSQLALIYPSAFLSIYYYISVVIVFKQFFFMSSIMG